jgi:hypothetical protein
VNGKLVVATEVRYRRSRMPDLSSGPGDTFGTTDIEGDVFVEPTTELSFVQNVTNGEFTALVLPTALQSVSRWQLFVRNSQSGTLDSYSLMRSDDGLFDLTDAITPPTGDGPVDPSMLVLPERSFTLTLNGASLPFASGPASAPRSAFRFSILPRRSGLLPLRKN